MAGFIGEAALGAGFEELLRAFLEAAKTAAKTAVTFRDALNEVASTLSSIQPKIKEIESFNKENDKVQETNQLLEIIHEGQELVSKCSQIKGWNIWKKNRYTRKLNKFNEKVLRYCQIDLPIQQARDIRNALFEVRSVSLEVRSVSLEVRRLNLREGSSSQNGMFSKDAVVGSSKVPEPLGKVIGFDVPLKELKMRLFEDGVSVIVVSVIEDIYIWLRECKIIE